MYTTIFAKSHKAAQKIFNLKIDGHILEKEQWPVYFRVILDRQMNVADHIQNLKNKVTKRLKKGKEPFQHK